MPEIFFLGMKHLDTNLSFEVRGKLKNFYRLIMSHGDFKQAHYIATRIDENFHNGDDRRPLEALNCAMIISYCRPFSGNDKKIQGKVPDLPESFLKGLSKPEKELHHIVMTDRNTVLAHTDSSAFNLRPQVWIVGEKKFLLPLSNDTKAPLTRSLTEEFWLLTKKLRDKSFKQRMKLEQELIGIFDVAPLGQILPEK